MRAVRMHAGPRPGPGQSTTRAVNGLRTGFWPGAPGPRPGPGPPPPSRARTLDGGLGLAVEVACGAERAAGAGHARCHPHAHPFQVGEAVGERLGLVLQLLPVPCRARGARQQLVPESLGETEMPPPPPGCSPRGLSSGFCTRPLVTSNLPWVLQTFCRKRP